MIGTTAMIPVWSNGAAREAMLQTPAESAAVLTLDCDQRIVHADSVAQRLFGSALQASAHTSFQQLVVRRCRQGYRDQMARLVRGDTRSVFLGNDDELYLQRGDGTEFLAEATVTKLPGARESLIVAVRDVTRAREQDIVNQFMAELGETLGASLDRATTIREFTRYCVERVADCCVVALEEDETHAATCVFTRRDAHSGRVQEGELTPAMVARLAPLAQAIATGRSLLLERRSNAVMRDDPTFFPSMSAYGSIALPLVAGRTTVGGIMLMSYGRNYQAADVDLVQRATQRLATAVHNARIYAAATHALRSHDDMLGFVSHDLRNPLNLITLAAGLLDHRTPAEDEFTHHWLDAIVQGARRMDSLITDLLTRTRAQAGGSALHPCIVPVEDLMREALALHDDEAERKQLHRVLHLTDVSLVVEVDHSAVVRALSNLIGNAVKLTPANGTITVAAERIEGMVQFSVADTGPGIEPEFIDHIFERFWRAPGSHAGGAGLGLAIVKVVVEAHGGRVWVASQLDAGSTFHLTLPQPAQTAATSTTTECADSWMA